MINIIILIFNLIRIISSLIIKFLIFIILIRKFII